ncbi:MAG TPA: serine/threonine-protein kinase [Drouetiella sp.]
MRSAGELLRLRPGGDIGSPDSDDEHEKAMRWRRKESTVLGFLICVTAAAALCFGAFSALLVCVFMCAFMISARMHEWIPSEKRARLKRSRPTRVMSRDGVKDLVLWLAYDPPNLLQKPLRVVGSASGIIQGVISFTLLVFFMRYGFFALLALFVGGLVTGYYVNIAMSRKERISRAHLLLTNEGLGFDFAEVGISDVAPAVEWDKFESVTFARARRLFTCNTELQFRLSMDDYPQECETILANFPGNYFVENIGTQRKVVVMLRSDGFASAIHRRELISFITGKIPADKIFGRHETTSSGMPDSSYTQLWLDSLSHERIRKGDLEPGAILRDGRYRIEKQIGYGGQGIAYLAVDAHTSVPVVLKEFVLPQTISVESQSRALSHVSAEATLLQSLAHPQIITFMESFIEDRRVYLATEFVDGPNLRQYVQSNGAVSESQALDLFVQMAQILDYLHSLDEPVIHRDFTPDNLVYMSSGKVKLLDFNVAQKAGFDSGRSVVGKHGFIPPEQFKGKPTTQSDLYALGATMFFLLTGVDPLPISTSHPRVIAPHVSSEMDAIVAKATDTSLETRYANASDILSDLKTFSSAGNLVNS